MPPTIRQWELRHDRARAGVLVEQSRPCVPDRSCVPVLVAALFAAACSDDSASDGTTGDTAASAPETTVEATGAPTTTAAPTTTVDPAEAAMAYTERGPYPVGVTTLQLPSGGAVEVWYPAVEGTTGTETYDVRDFTPDALKALLTADVPATFSYSAGRDAAVADGSFPVVAFSHGAIGFRLQSTGLTSHLASWGMVVVSTDHPQRDLAHLLDLLNTPTERPADSSADELTSAIDLIIQEGETEGSPFFGTIDDTHIATLGHSAGGGTAFRVAAADARVDGYVSMASGVIRTGNDTGNDTGNGTTRGTGEGSTTTVEATTSTTEPVFPEKPSFFIAGSADNIAVVDSITRPTFDAAPSPSLLWIIEGAGHLAFSDLCSLGDGLSIIDVARASGLGDFLDTVPNVVRLGSDGCEPPALPVADTLPIIEHAVTAWLRSPVRHRRRRRWASTSPSATSTRRRWRSSPADRNVTAQVRRTSCECTESVGEATDRTPRSD